MPPRPATCLVLALALLLSPLWCVCAAAAVPAAAGGDGAASGRRCCSSAAATEGEPAAPASHRPHDKDCCRRRAVTLAGAEHPIHIHDLAAAPALAPPPPSRPLPPTPAPKILAGAAHVPRAPAGTLVSLGCLLTV